MKGLITGRNDAKSVSIVALGCLHPVIKVQSSSMHFFLGSDQEQDEEDEEEVRLHPLICTVINMLFRALISKACNTNAKSIKRLAVARKRWKSK